MSETEDQVAGAFKTLFNQTRESLGEPTIPSEPVAEQVVAPVETAPDPAAQAPSVASTEPEPPDELTQMRAELASTRSKASESIEWGRKGFLRKSNEADTAKRFLRQALENPEGVSKEEVARFLSGEAGPPAQAPPYQPAYTQAAPPVAPDERMMMDTSQFLFDYGLSETQAKGYMEWIGGPANTLTERDIVPGDHYSTLRHGYERYKESTSRPDPVMVQAAASVARTQREVARSAGGNPARTLPTPEPVAKDPMRDMTVQERVDSGFIEAQFKALAQEWGNR